MKKRLFCCFLLCCMTSSLEAGELSRSRAELDALASKIDELQTTLNENVADEKSVTSVLDQLEFEQSGLRKEIRAKQADKAAIEVALDSLEEQSVALAGQSENAKQRLGGLLKSGYILGKQSALRMFVNQQNPHTAARRLTMFKYVMEARNKQLESFAALQVSLVENRRLSTNKRDEMAQAILALDAKKASLVEKETLRLQERDKLRLAMADSTDTLAGYQQRQKSLERLIKQLSRPKPKPIKKPQKPVQAVVRQKSEQAPVSVNGNAVVSVDGTSSGQPESTVTQMPQQSLQPAPKQTTAETAPKPAQKLMSLAGFGKAKGRLPRPLNAGVKVRFGDKKQESGLRWDGILFNAKDKQAVQAIYPGQVVFSDWFRGYGQLMVVDHGEGYMSLYGHNQQLNVSVGDQVQSGQTIAMASDASERPLPGLYFEIRHNGAPNDPLKWIK